MCGVNQFWIIVFFAAVKPANNILFCIELIQRPESSLRRHKLGLTDNQFAVMMIKPGLHVSIDWWWQDIPKTYAEQKSAWWCSVTYMAVQIWLQFHFKSFVRSYVCSMNDFEVGLGDMANKMITIILFISVDIDNYHDKCQIFISFKFKPRILLQSESCRNQTINFP